MVGSVNRVIDLVSYNEENCLPSKRMSASRGGLCSHGCFLSALEHYFTRYMMLRDCFSFNLS